MSSGLPAETVFVSTTQDQGYTNSGDYTGKLNQTLSFALNQTQATVTVAITNDSTVESNETFGLIVQRNSTDPLSTFLAKATFTIVDNDTLPTTYSISPNPASVNEGAGSVSFTVTRSGGLPAETIYASTTQDQGYSNSGDYTGLLNQALVFAANQTQATVTFGITNDSIAEPSESFGLIVQRSATDPVTIYLANAVFTIADDDGPVDTSPPTISASSFEFSTEAPRLRVQFSEDVHAGLSAAAVVIKDLTTGVEFNPSGMTYDPSTNTAVFTLPAPLANASYRATIAGTGVHDAASNTMVGDYVFNFWFLAGDANRDQVVNFDDLLVLAKNYSKTGATWAQGDFTGDGLVNFDDLLILAKNYNKTLPAAGAAPVPAATVDVKALAAAMGIAVPTAPTTRPAEPPVSPKPAPKPVSKPVVPAPTVAKPPAPSVLRDDDKAKPVFSTTRVAKPAPAKPKAVTKAKGR